MKNLKLICGIAIFLVVVAMLTEVEGRRKILKGRRTITRTYYKASAIPPWAIILLVSLGEILIGVGQFFLMKKLILDPTLRGNYSLPKGIK